MIYCIIYRQNIKEDMNLWEASKMWPFSCFSHEVGAQCLSGILISLSNLLFMLYIICILTSEEVSLS